MTLNRELSRRNLTKSLLAGAAVMGLPRTTAAAEVHAGAVSVSEPTVLHPGVWRIRVGEPEAFTPVSSRLIPPSESAFAHLPEAGKLPYSRIGATQQARGCLVKLPLWADEQIYGLGLQLLSFAQRGLKKTVRVNADPRMDTGDSHAPVPFYVTTGGVGVLIDTARYASFYLGSAHLPPQQATAAAHAADVDPAYGNVETANQEDFVLVDIPGVRGVDVYLFAGPSMLDAVKRYNAFSGGGAMPPEWALGFWFRAMAKDTQADALSLADEFRDRKIPCDVFGLEPGWQSHAYSCSFVWDQVRFPDPHQLLSAAREKNLHINLWEHAFTHTSSPLFDQLKPYSGNLAVWRGLVPDFAAQPARDIFGEFHGRTLIDAGVSGFKLDECDNSDFTRGWSFPECSRFPSGVDGEQMHSVFGLRYQAAIWGAYKKRGLSTFGLVRSSGALAAPYPFVLYSDLYNHRDYIRALANSGFSGLLWCPEVRQADTEEDLIRRLQSVVFSPLAQVDCWYMPSPPWKQTDRAKNNAGQFLPHWEQLEARCREIIGWRMSLAPYLTSIFQAYERDGTPPFRALVLDWPADKRLQRVDDQFLMGDRMMVAPLFAGEASRKVVMPPGRWHDFWTGKAVQGGTDLLLTADTVYIPVFIKSGSVMPWAGVGQHAGDPAGRELTVRIYGDGSMPFSMDTGAGPVVLSWKHEAGQATGGSGSYRVVSWQRMG